MKLLMNGLYIAILAIGVIILEKCIPLPPFTGLGIFLLISPFLAVLSND